MGFMYSPQWKITHQKPSVLCTPPFENHPSKAIGFVYSPLWKSPIKSHQFYVLPPLKITHQKPSVLCTPPSENSLFLVGVYLGKYGKWFQLIFFSFLIGKIDFSKWINFFPTSKSSPKLFRRARHITSVLGKKKYSTSSRISKFSETFFFTFQAKSTVRWNFPDTNQRRFIFLRESRPGK